MNTGIVVLGSLNMDFVVTVEHLPAPGETVLGRDFQMIPGGKGANQACAAGKAAGAAARVSMIGRVGYDLFADHLRASLSAAGVDVHQVHSTKTQPTGVALIWVDRSGQNSIVVAPGANHEMKPSDAEAMRAVFRGARIALFQLETPLDTVCAALAIAKQEGARTILDPAPAQPLGKEILSTLHLITPNESEACILLHRPPARISPAEAPAIARSIRNLGPQAVILKLGEHGCFYYDGSTEIHSPAPRVDVRDTTAAGDTFNGALAVALAEERPIAEALAFANKAAAISVTRLGAQASIPTRAEIDAFRPQ